MHQMHKIDFLLAPNITLVLSSAIKLDNTIDCMSKVISRNSE